MFNIDFNKLAVRLLPTFLRGSILVAWAKILLAELGYSNTALQAFASTTLKELNYNGQTIMLEKMLNDYFPGAVPLIFITLVDDGYPEGFEFDTYEGQPMPGFEYDTYEGVDVPGFEYDTYEYDNRIDFIINVPSMLTFDEHQMTARVLKYCKASRNFTINVY